VPEFWQRRQFISGFEGSAGDVLITQSKAGLWTDSRYFLQAEKQLDPAVFTLFKLGIPGVPAWQEWIKQELGPGEALGVDPRLISHRQFSSLKKELSLKGIILRRIAPNLVDLIRPDRPEPPRGKIIGYPFKYAGESVTSKLRRLRKKMAAEGADAHVIAALDAIAWLFNIRGSDVRFNPVVISYALVTADTAKLFIDPDKVQLPLRRALAKHNVEILDYQKFGSELKSLGKKKIRIWLDDSSVSQRVVDRLEGKSQLILKPSPIALFKAVKNPTEIAGFRTAHIRDGVAMVRFLCWLDRALGKKKVTERDAAAKCSEFRAQDPLSRGPSFETISAFGGHGAVVHYESKPETNARLRHRGIYLIDSGGHYLDGSTDITRTIALGPPTTEQRDRFTRVLKGLIALSEASFPQGTVGRQLDILARLALWEKGLNYGHGTGHGVGTFLNVHEGPQALTHFRCPNVGLEPGMVTTIEPGFYKENTYGLRLENLALVVKDNRRSKRGSLFYKFETLTLCPIDISLIKKELLTPSEVLWLNDYHRKVRRVLTPYLSAGEARWLKSATRPL
jgi:Xaa-Pro aminopeptidase